MHRKIAALLAALLLLAGASRAQQSSLLWEVSGKGITHPSYLFGTIHMICPDDFFLTPAMTEKFKKAQTVYLEIKLDAQGMQTDALRLMELIQLKDGQKLSDYFDTAQYRRLSLFVHDSLGLDIGAFDSYKPLMLFSVLSSKLLPCAQDQAYELKFAEMAKDQNKPVKGLEKMEDQLAVFDSIPRKDQASMIMEVVDHYGRQKEEFQHLLSLYKAQQVDSLYQLMASEPDPKINEDLLLNHRNQHWIPIISRAMQAGSCFIAIGAGHLGGPQGLISLLRKRGYTVRPVR